MKSEFKLLDAGGDEIKCKVTPNNCIKINTKRWQYIELTLDNIEEMVNRIEDRQLFEDVKEKLNSPGLGSK